ncbi:uncharacterized protein G2W53_015336 [Senna tora]|uniref:Uncharacterized protein n=1 Tax=Senna tora TaxID=362788 RepID=A0A834WUT7_9FABA|nr:uncharacterized protein G2W53_015336 [Senna tora]
MHGVGGEGKQVEGIVGMFIVKGSMAFWYSGSGERYGTFKEKGKVFADKANVFRFPSTSEHTHETIPRLLGSCSTLIHDKAYVPLECKPSEVEMEICEKELLISSPLPHGQAISFKKKLQITSSRAEEGQLSTFTGGQ